MGKHTRADQGGTAKGTAAQQAADRRAAEAEELRKLESKLRREGKIK